MGDTSAWTLLGRAIPAVFFIAALAGTLWWLRRGRPLGTRALTVEARTALSRASVVAVMRVDGRRYLIGATDASVTLLAELGETSLDPIPTPDTEEPWKGLVHTLQQRTLRTVTPRPSRD